MASFDFQSGMRGAAAGGSVGGPYGAAAGFVVGGFVGGHKKKSAAKKLKKKKRRYEKNYAKLTSPKHLGELVSQFRPLFREQALGGAAPQTQAGIESALGRFGYEGTGIGGVAKAISTTAPDILAFNAALPIAENQWDREIAEFNRKALSENIGWRGQPIKQQDPFGSAGPAVDALGASGGMGGGMMGGMMGGAGGGGMGGGGFNFMSMFGGANSSLGSAGGSNYYLGSMPGQDVPGYGMGAVSTPNTYSYQLSPITMQPAYNPYLSVPRY